MCYFDAESGRVTIADMMSAPSRRLAIVLGGLLLGACSGGSNTGDGSSPVAATVTSAAPAPTPATPAKAPPYTFDPATLSAKYMVGYPATISVKAWATAVPTSLTYADIYMYVDGGSSGVIASTQVTRNSDGTFTLVVKTAANATPGHYAGTLIVNACTDANCLTPLDGSPIKLPYVIDVLPQSGGATTSNLSTLSAFMTAGDWSGYQGNAAHTGMVSVTLAPSAFTTRWTYKVPAVTGNQMLISDIVTGNGRIYFSTGLDFDSSQQGHLLFALNEQDGSQAWIQDFADLGPYATTNPPAFSNGKVYLSAGVQKAAAMFGFDAANGAQLFKTPTPWRWQHYRAPVVFADALVSGGGVDGGIYQYNTDSGALQWFAPLPDADGWAPAIDNDYIYVFVRSVLKVNKRTTGLPAGQITGPEPDLPSGLTPLIGATNNVTVAGSTALMNFDIAASRMRWSVSGSYHAGPAYDSKVIYVLRDKALALQAVNEADGSLAWSWTPPATAGSWNGNVLLTNNLVFVSTDTATYAIDRTTHAQVWTYPAGGTLSLSSNGVLYIAGASNIAAVNVK